MDGKNQADALIELARKKIEAKKVALIAAEIEPEIRRATNKEIKARRSEIRAIAKDAVAAELQDPKFRKQVSAAVVRHLKTEMQEENIANIFPDLMGRVTDLLIKEIFSRGETHK